MRRIALGFLLAGLAVYAQPDLLTQAPAVIARCSPQYTPEAKRASIEGKVVLYIQVYPDGTAHNIKVQSSLGSGLDEKAIEAVKQWRFSPGTKYGKPVIVPATIEVKFRLNDMPCGAASNRTQTPKPGRVWFGAGNTFNMSLTAQQRRNFLRFLNRHELKRFLVVDGFHKI